MSMRADTALKSVGTVIAALCLQAVIRGVFKEDDELLWGAVGWAPGGHDGQLVLLVCVGLAGTAVAGLAHMRQKRLAAK